MLSLKNIEKSYETNNKKNKVLIDININFRKNEFVVILGPSGSGKTTLLNIIGGILKSDKGSIIIDGIDTNKYKDYMWDSYRNKKIGFIFQNYNLLPNLSASENVTLPALINNKNEKEKAKLLLNKFKITDISKKCKNLSGGESQRVAIARSLINDPDMILADEPTGALDTSNSAIIMEYMKNISKDKLVIMVTHNEDLAKKYATRIIKMQDGKIISDSNPYNGKEKVKKEIKKKNKEQLSLCFKLALTSILTKKGRSFLTSLGCAIGIIGISLVLSLSNGFKSEINNFEKNTLISLPIVISDENYTLENDEKTYPKNEKIKKEETKNSHTNIITKDYLEMLENNKNILGLSYKYNFLINLINKKENGYINKSNNEISMGVIPNNDVINMQYDILKGRLPIDKNEILLVVDGNNAVDENILNILNIKEGDSFNEILTKNVKIVLNNDFYKKENNFFVINKDLELLYKSKGKTLSVVGIIRMKKEFPSYMSTSGILYTKDLSDYIINVNSVSDIVMSQKSKDINVLTGNAINTKEKEELLSLLGDKTLPKSINIYSKDFNSKEKLIKDLSKYNDNKKDEEKIMYTDQAEVIVSLSDNILSSITIVLLFFSIISLIVATIMIGIIVYISVLERKREIGILRSLGMSKKGIKKIFNIEGLIIAFIAFIFGTIISRLLIIPVNMILEKLTSIKGIAHLDILSALILLIINILISITGTLIPSKYASKLEIASSIKED